MILFYFLLIDCTFINSGNYTSTRYESYIAHHKMKSVKIRPDYVQILLLRSQQQQSRDPNVIANLFKSRISKA